LPAREEILSIGNLEQQDYQAKDDTFLQVNDQEYQSLADTRKASAPLTSPAKKFKQTRKQQKNSPTSEPQKLDVALHNNSETKTLSNEAALRQNWQNGAPLPMLNSPAVSDFNAGILAPQNVQIQSNQDDKHLAVYWEAQKHLRENIQKKHLVGQK